MLLLLYDVTGERSADDDDEAATDEDDYMTSEFKSPEQIAHSLITLSSLPNSRWLNLLSLDVIKVRTRTGRRAPADRSLTDHAQRAAQLALAQLAQP